MNENLKKVAETLKNDLSLKEKLTAKQYLFIFLVILGIIILAIVEGDA